jgi:hypothetical protein
MADWTPPRRIYAAEFKCGVVKVGNTSQPNNNRARGLSFKGYPPVRVYYGERHECGGWPEWELLARIRRMASPIKGKEWFVGVRFNVARQLVDQITRTAHVMQAQQPA